MGTSPRAHLHVAGSYFITAVNYTLKSPEPRRYHLKPKLLAPHPNHMNKTLNTRELYTFKRSPTRPLSNSAALLLIRVTHRNTLPFRTAGTWPYLSLINVAIQYTDDYLLGAVEGSYPEKIQNKLRSFRACFESLPATLRNRSRATSRALLIWT